MTARTLSRLLREHKACFRSLAIHIAVAGIVGLPELTFSEPPAADCNGNGVDDALDVQLGSLSFEQGVPIAVILSRMSENTPNRSSR